MAPHLHGQSQCPAQLLCCTVVIKRCPKLDALARKQAKKYSSLEEECGCEFTRVNQVPVAISEEIVYTAFNSSLETEKAEPEMQDEDACRKLFEDIAKACEAHDTKPGLIFCLSCLKDIDEAKIVCHLRECNIKKCPLCGLTCLGSDIVPHIEEHLKSENLRERVSCPLCWATFFNEYNLSEHELNIHVC